MGVSDADESQGREPKKEQRGGFWGWLYNYLVGAAQVDGAIGGFTAEARQAWKRDLENRRRHDREQRERKQAGRQG